MKYIQTVLIIASVLLSQNLSSQIDQEILSFVDSTELQINNGRKLLLKSINNKDFAKAGEVYDYLVNLTGDDRCSAFFYDEELYITAILSKWDRWMQLAVDVENYNKTVCYNNIFNIEPELYEYIRNNADELRTKSNSLNPEDADMITLYVGIIESGEVNEEYNAALRKYKSDYSKTKYQKFINLYMPRIMVKSSYGFVIGASYIHPTYNLYHYFRPDANFHMGMDFNIGKVYSSLYVTAGSLKFDNDLTTISNNRFVDFERGDRFTYFEGGIAAGYFVVRNERFHVAPYGLLGGCSLESNIYDPEEYMEDYEFQVFNSFVCGLGLHTEFKFAGYEFNSTSMYGGYDYKMKHHFSLKLDVGFNYITNHKWDYFDGDVIYIKPALVWGIGDF